MGQRISKKSKKKKIPESQSEGNTFEGRYDPVILDISQKITKENEQGDHETFRHNSTQNNFLVGDAMDAVATGLPEHEEEKTANGEESQKIADELPEPIVGEIVIALRDFEARTSSEVSFQQGDAMDVLEEINKDYLFVSHQTLLTKGFIPKAFVTQQWFFGKINRKDAENNLMKDKNEVGAFLIRKAVSSKPFHQYSLSLKINDGGKINIQHYRIFHEENTYRLNSLQSFFSLRELINFHCQNQEKIKFVLGKPCQWTFPRYDVDATTRDHWEIDRSQLTFIKVLGSGNFGDVWLGELNGGLKVAIKTLKETKESFANNTSKAIKEFLKEASIMKQLKHRHILPLYAVCSTQMPIYIITEFMDLGSLLEVLRQKVIINNLKKRIVVAYQIASGMLYLEEQKLIHRDLAARNVLVNSEMDCKIGDFGLSKICQDEYTVEGANKFPVKWAAPECLNFQTYSIKSDVWGFGIVLYEIFTHGRIPYPAMTNNEVYMKVTQGYRMKQPLECPDDLFREIIERCWQEEPSDRLAFHSIVDYLDNYDPSTDKKYH